MLFFPAWCREDFSFFCCFFFLVNQFSWRTQFKLLKKNQEHKVLSSSLLIQNPEILDGVDDMTTLSYLHEPAILQNLQTSSLNMKWRKYRLFSLTCFKKKDITEIPSIPLPAQFWLQSILTRNSTFIPIPWSQHIEARN